MEHTKLVCRVGVLLCVRMDSRTLAPRKCLVFARCVSHSRGIDWVGMWLQMPCSEQIRRQRRRRSTYKHLKKKAQLVTA